MNRILKFLLMLPIGLCCSGVGAQPVQEVNAMLKKIAGVYDTMINMTCNVQYRYLTDTLNGKSSENEVKGDYVLENKNAAYRFGQMECIQNDSFFVAVYRDEKFIIVSNPKGNANTRFFPVKNSLDSMLKLSADRYEAGITHLKNKQLDLISFKAKKPDEEKVQLFEMYFDSKTSLIYSLVYHYTELEKAAPEADSDDPVVRRKMVAVELKDYTFLKQNSESFSESKYIHFVKGECKPADAFYEYKVYYRKLPDTIK